jgi:hypothetical protein
VGSQNFIPLICIIKPSQITEKSEKSARSWRRPALLKTPALAICQTIAPVHGKKTRDFEDLRPAKNKKRNFRVEVDGKRPFVPLRICIESMQAFLNQPKPSDGRSLAANCGLRSPLLKRSGSSTGGLAVSIRKKRQLQLLCPIHLQPWRAPDKTAGAGCSNRIPLAHAE